MDIWCEPSATQRAKWHACQWCVLPIALTSTSSVLLLKNWCSVGCAAAMSASFGCWKSWTGRESKRWAPYVGRRTAGWVYRRWHLFQQRWKRNEPVMLTWGLLSCYCSCATVCSVVFVTRLSKTRRSVNTKVMEQVNVQIVVWLPKKITSNGTTQPFSSFPSSRRMTLIRCASPLI